MHARSYSYTYNSSLYGDKPRGNISLEDKHEDTLSTAEGDVWNENKNII